MIKQIKIGQKDIHFARIGGKVIYPSYVAKDNLVLHYDFSGRTNLDVKKGIAEDLSGNGNDGILENFAYESGSGYDSNSYLEFDNVDDFITIPELNLDVNNFTVAVDGEVLSYRGDNVAKINENGLEIGERNLIRNSNIFTTGWLTYGGVQVIRTPDQVVSEWQATDATKIETVGGSHILKFYKALSDTIIGDTYTISIWVKNDSDSNLNIHFNGGTVLSGSSPLSLDPGFSGRVIYIVECRTIYFQLHFRAPSAEDSLNFTVWRMKVEKGTIATDWTPASEDFQTTRITPFFSNKIKTLMYWNVALTDTELQEVYNVQKHRI